MYATHISSTLFLSLALQPTSHSSIYHMLASPTSHLLHQHLASHVLPSLFSSACPPTSRLLHLLLARFTHTPRTPPALPCLTCPSLTAPFPFLTHCTTPLSHSPHHPPFSLHLRFTHGPPFVSPSQVGGPEAPSGPCTGCLCCSRPVPPG